MKLRHLPVLLTLLLTASLAVAQDSPAPPTDPASAMFTLQDLWNRLSAGTAGIKRPGAFVEPGMAPGTKTMRTLDELLAKAPAVDDSNGATAAQVLAGRTFWGLRSGGWGLLTGAMAAGANVLGGNGLLTFSIPDGAYSGRTATAVDANLVTGNIKASATIFGVTGKTEVVDTTTGDATAADLALGKKAWVKGVEITGSLVVPAVNSMTFSFTGAAQTWTAPAGVTSVTIECWGAQGGGIYGGNGGYAKGNLAVTPGDVLRVYVGGTGGWNGGGFGYGGPGGGTIGAVGGGGSDVRVDPAALGNRIIVAGGGGGTGGGNGGPGGLGGGGNGGFGRGGIGYGILGGYGAGWYSGGAGGLGDPGGLSGAGGGVGFGGDGGPHWISGGGGGGGGGWYGGGGGAGGGLVGGGAGGGLVGDGGGGGGGGSNHVDIAMTAPLMGNLGNTGDGKVVISW